MADVMTAAQLSALIRTTGTRLELLLAPLAVQQMNKSGAVGVWSVKDVLAHLAYWERYAVGILRAVAHGETPDFVTDDETERYNASVVAQYYQRPLSSVIAEWQAAREDLLDLIENLSDDDLNDPNRFTWSHGRTLLDHIASSAYRHEQEHIEQLREWISHRG